MTTEAWVKPTALGQHAADRAAQGAPGGIGVRPATRTARPSPRSRRPRSRPRRTRRSRARARSRPTPGRISPPRTTATTLRLYVNGMQVGRARGQRARSRPRPGRCGSAGTPCSRRELQRSHRRGPDLRPRARPRRDPDRHERRRSAPPDTQPPTAPQSLTADRLAHVRAADVDRRPPTTRGVVRYNVHRSTTSGFTPTAANRIAQPTGTTATPTPRSPRAPTTTGSPPRTRPGNVSAASNEATATRRRHRRRRRRPGTLTATRRRSAGHADLGRRDRQRGRRRATTSTARRRAASRRARRTGSRSRRHELHRHRRSPGTYYYRSPPRTRPATSAPSPTRRARSSPPTRTRRAPPAASPRRRPARRSPSSWTASTDNVGVVRYNVHRVDDQRLHAARREPDRPADRRRRYTDGGLAAGTYYYKVTAEDAAGNISAPVRPGERDRRPTSAPTGLVAAYGFDEGTGTTTADSSGNGNTGTLTNATWTTAGKFGKALSFNGTQRPRQRRRQRLAAT